MIYPLANHIITQQFGDNPDDYLIYGYPGHNGLDLTTNDSPPIVYNFTAGRCVKVGWQENGYGKYIVIQFSTYEIYYCHLAKVLIKPGNQVVEGEPIALMGNTGNSSGPHLHFGIRKITGIGAYHGFVDPIPSLNLAIQPTICSLTIEDFEPTISVLERAGNKPHGKPVTHGKRTMYPRIKYF